MVGIDITRNRGKLNKMCTAQGKNALGRTLFDEAEMLELRALSLIYTQLSIFRGKPTAIILSFSFGLL